MSTTTASNKDLGSSLSDIFSSKPVTPSSNTYEPGNGFTSGETGMDTGFFSNITWQTWLIIILILALLGINIFIYLAKGTGAVAEFINTYFGPVLKFFGITVLETTKQTINVAATGTKAGVDAVADTTTGAIDYVEKGATNTTTMNTTTNTTNTYKAKQTTGTQQNAMPVQQQIQEGGSVSEWNQDNLDNALNDASKNSEPQPDQSISTVQSSGKAGWCYIGMDRGTRACSEVGVNDMCMSGNIFPSQDICMNPNLRA
jgi:hypothetical protein